MATKPPPVPVKAPNPPFMPPVIIQHSPANLGNPHPAPVPTGAYTGPREDGASAYKNYDGTPIGYNGQTQTAKIQQTFRP